MVYGHPKHPKTHIHEQLHHPNSRHGDLFREIHSNQEFRDLEEVCQRMRNRYVHRCLDDVEVLYYLEEALQDRRSKTRLLPKTNPQDCLL